VSAIEIKLRVHFEAHPSEPLTAAQLAQRLSLSVQSVQYKLAELAAEGFVKRKRSHQCMRPYVWIRADQAWPDDTAVIARATAQRISARAAQH
jgi:predicted ArsR family transcriptional regulator